MRRGSARGRSEAAGGERFGDLYDAHFQAIYGYVWRRVAPAQAADVVQEVFAAAWRASGAIPAPPEDRLWLYGVARRVVSRSHWEIGRQGRLRERLARETGRPGTTTPGLLEPPETPLIGALRHLRPRDREIVRLIIWDDLDRSEVARVLGCSTNAVDIRFHRALKRLRAELLRPQQGEKPPSAPVTAPSVVVTAHQGVRDA